MARKKNQKFEDVARLYPKEKTATWQEIYVFMSLVETIRATSWDNLCLSTMTKLDALNKTEISQEAVTHSSVAFCSPSADRSLLSPYPSVMKRKGQKHPQLVSPSSQILFKQDPEIKQMKISRNQADKAFQYQMNDMFLKTMKSEIARNKSEVEKNQAMAQFFTKASGASSISLKIDLSKDVSAVQDEQQAADVKNDELVVNKTDVQIMRHPGLEESCDKGISVTSNEKDMKNSMNDLSGEFNNLDINENPKVTHERTNLNFSETKKIHSCDNISAKEVFASVSQKSVDADLVDKKYLDKLELPLKEFRFGFGHLKKILDVGNKVIKIADYFNLNDQDRKSILLTDHGGGNHALSFLNYLRMYQPYLTIASFCKCLRDHRCIEAENFISKYNGQEMFQKISHKDVRDLSFKLIPPAESNLAIWKDLAADLEISSVDVSNIENTGRQPAKYSQTEELFKIISTQFPHYTIGEFLKVLEELKLIDALDLMKEKIIASMKMQNEIFSLK